ncbi:MAG: methylated-DNA--[protein]-cysteine S-methyltransferase [Chloroflexi bacterium]|nr:methylated-DNA--[protein]-cysteine S-methyltransferase [Ardenticatenaceae bacterium]MBL1128052.1 methylated-DNA--[protein]-cysteine S-methyltransferase [Chloroflexota bacterium]NOG34124.1 methylated-DNA--[protein]-cysteine S-methyltransferase [Chloroflexota bacterium]GIK56877.1 MAG: 6-O-methylguanine DNA methyltransferase [Chloroflexota bacterium]
MFTQASADYALVEKAIHYLEENYQDQPALADVAAHVGLSEFHFQRLFRRWAGISPKRFGQYLTMQHAKQVLAESQNVLEAAYAAGLSGPGRLHDLFVTHEAVTPGEYKTRGAGLTIRYGFHPTPFGEALLAETERGICGLSFITGNGRAAAFADLTHAWPQAVLAEDAVGTATAVNQIFTPADERQMPLPVFLKGTNFQIQVWMALLRVPPGALVTYGALARAAGQEKAVRAVGTAVGHNPIAYLIPCHRVIQKSGNLGGYHWGLPRKKALIGWEAAHAGWGE